MASRLYAALTLLVVHICTAIPLGRPDFESQWYDLTVYSGLNSVHIPHGLGEMPVYVQVQVKTDNQPNDGFIFPGIGTMLRDDDYNTPYSGMVYLYNEHEIVISAPVRSNAFVGSCIYTENSEYWEGPNSQDEYHALVRARLWLLKSFPTPDFHVSGLPIASQCETRPGTICYYEKHHGLGEYPTFAVVRSKLGGSLNYTGYMADALGASHMAYLGNQYTSNNNVIYGFNHAAFRVWSETGPGSTIFSGDGYTFKEGFIDGQVEIMAWGTSSLEPDLERNLELGAIPGTDFQMETTHSIHQRTDDVVGMVWVEAHDGFNQGFRFPGAGAMAYSPTQTASPCSYGGLMYAYTNTTLRMWKPRVGSHGSVVCISETFGQSLGWYSQATNDASTYMKMWTVTSLEETCLSDVDCTDTNTACINSVCVCKTGYFLFNLMCTKELTCLDVVPTVPDLGLRPRNNVLDGFQQALDDSRLTESWYQASNQDGQWLMPDSHSLPINGSCGSYNPYYVVGTHPPLEQLTETGQTLQVRYLHDGTTQDLMIRKCGETIQYRLRQLDTSGAFCFDSPQLQGQLASGFVPAPTGVNIGNLNVDVELKFTTQTLANGQRYEPYLEFQCTSDNMVNMPVDIYFTTLWYVDGDLLETYGPSSTITTLTEQTLLIKSKKLNINIHCGVQMSASEVGLKTAPIESSSFYAGIRFDSNSIVMRKGESAALMLEPTVPIGCAYSDTEPSDCLMGVYIEQPDPTVCDRNGLVSLQHTGDLQCGTPITTLRVGETWVPGSYPFNVTSVDNDYSDKAFYRLQLVTDDVGHPIWRSLRLPSVPIHITYSSSTKYILCYSHVDPHQRTFDGYLYENQYEGIFIQYLNSKYGIEVQTQTTKCNRNRAYCVCAVAVRAGGDVFQVNLCNGVRFIGFTSCRDNGILHVERISSKKYKVVTPIGTSIDIIISPHRGYTNLINLDIYAAAKDFQTSEGLCGYYDNYKESDLMRRGRTEYFPINQQSGGRNYHKEFSEEWTLRTTDTNYLVFNRNVPRWNSTSFCACSSSENSPMPVAVCSPLMHFQCPAEYDTTNVECVTYDAEYEITELTRRLGQNLTPVPGKKKREAVADITESEAEAICRNVIQNHEVVTDFSHRLIGIDIEAVIQECSFDVSEEDDASWADVYPPSLINIIENFNEKDPEYRANNPDEVLRFTALLCPWNCSGNGVCNSEGVCECNAGYFGPDCAHNVSAALAISNIYGDGFCDTSDNNPCICFNVQTENLIANFSCNVTRRQIFFSGTDITKETVTLSGSYVNDFNGLCCVTDLSQQGTTVTKEAYVNLYDVSITNDAVSFSNSRTMIVFDSSCQNVSINNAVTLKDHSCFIDGKCRVENETDINDACLSCRPNTNAFTWSYVCSGPEDSKSSNHHIFLIIIPACIAVAIALGAVIGWNLNKRKRILPESRQIKVRSYDEEVFTLPSNKKYFASRGYL